MSSDTQTVDSGAGPSPASPTSTASQWTRGSDRGQATELVSLVVAIGVALYVAAAVLIPAAQDYAGANTSNLTATQTAVAGLVVILAIIALAMAFLNAAESVM